MARLFLIISSRKEVSTTAQRLVITQYMVNTNEDVVYIYEAHKIAQSKNFFKLLLICQ